MRASVAALNAAISVQRFRLRRGGLLAVAGVRRWPRPELTDRGRPHRPGFRRNRPMAEGPVVGPGDGGLLDLSRPPRPRHRHQRRESAHRIRLGDPRLPDLHRIELYIEPWNTGSIKVAETVSYGREGPFRSHQEIGGTRRDMLLNATARD